MWKSFQKELYPFKSSENHTYQKPYKCKDSGKAFAQKAALAHNENIQWRKAF